MWDGHRPQMVGYWLSHIMAFGVSTSEPVHAETLRIRWALILSVGGTDD